jgi:hypothetical protein
MTAGIPVTRALSVSVFTAAFTAAAFVVWTRTADLTCTADLWIGAGWECILPVAVIRVARFGYANDAELARCR